MRPAHKVADPQLTLDEIRMQATNYFDFITSHRRRSSNQGRYSFQSSIKLLQYSTGSGCGLMSMGVVLVEDNRLQRWLIR